MIQPLEDRVLIQPEEAEHKTAGGILLPENAQEKPQRGEVLTVGPGRTTDTGEILPVSVQPGDTVLYSKYGGTEIEDDLLILNSRDILAVVR